MDIFNAYIKHALHPTFPDCGDSIVNCLQNYAVSLQREDAPDDQIYQAIDKFKWYPDGGGPPAAIHNLPVFCKTVVQRNIKQTNVIASKA